MKVKITKPDGTVIEAEGTAEECERIVGAPQPAMPPFPADMLKVYPGTPHPWESWPWPWQPGVTWCTSADNISVTTIDHEVRRERS